MQDSNLILGWQVSKTLQPSYWLNADAKPGSQSEADLVRVPAETASAHTAIIAQSGSGKSFFLGRLVEELLLQTKSRCLIIDPNADFRKSYDVEGADLWEKARYDPHSRGGKLPAEATREDFKKLWTGISVRVRMGAASTRENVEALNLRWTAISHDFLTDDVGAAMRGQMYHCHAFVKALKPLIEAKARAANIQVDLIERAEEIFTWEKRSGDGTVEKSVVCAEFEETLKTVKPDSAAFRSYERAIDRAVKAVKYVEADAQRLYFGQARQYQASGILDTKLPATKGKGRARLEVIDLPSLPDKATRLLAINAILANEWERVRDEWERALLKPASQDKRFPTFVIVDEAHNLIPADPQTQSARALREQFRTIIAEGRKYGIFLILVSQRPDKLDPMVLSECENKAIMRLSSRSVLDQTVRTLGLEDIGQRELSKCLDFELGRVLLVGSWAPDGPRLCYAAARRTVEGGRNLRKAHWAVP